VERWLPRGVGPAWASASRVAVGEKSALFEAIRSNYVDTTDMALNAVTPDASRPAGGPDRIHGVGARGGALNTTPSIFVFNAQRAITDNAQDVGDCSVALCAGRCLVRPKHGHKPDAMYFVSGDGSMTV